MTDEETSILSVAAVISVVVWTGFMAVLCLWNITNEKEQTHKLLEFQCQAMFAEVVTTRSWNASHGGVYVPVTPQIRPNPYLNVTDRDVTTLSGMQLTKINPAYMTRQIGEIAAARHQVWFHLTSDNPIRPENVPDDWEARALKGFVEKGADFSEFISTEECSGHFRYMAPLWVEESCLTCHGDQGYKKGDLRGGISVSVSADPVLAIQTDAIQKSTIGFFSVWVVGFFGICLGYRLLKTEESKRRDLISELQVSLSEVKTLSGLLPICAHCKRIRDDKGYWEQIESYIQKHSDAEFSHGICRECINELYPDLGIPE
ncbi:hypothetical protein DSLASN_43210 [Desulfoluna limicola]|uniref:Tll0287-like domain-containing protein n=1 Tax=Desulfoluna limicola TaxID=2810562 RepID=A0ABM7PMJ4_9BACT|nr:DUF3365 domain-containing protein [Desulfoluna limicola]BCS98689.1 hypothetical protein DSLASN_43210 [Desulfoluna limicola]